MRKFFKKGSAEMVSIILGIVVIGGLALAITGTFSKQGRASFEKGMTTQTTQMTNNFNEASTQRIADVPELDSTNTVNGN